MGVGARGSYTHTFYAYTETRKTRIRWYLIIYSRRYGIVNIFSFCFPSIVVGKWYIITTRLRRY